MRIVLSIIQFWCWAQASSLGGELTNISIIIYPSEVLTDVSNILLAARTDVAEQLRARIRADLVDEKELLGIVAALDHASEKLNRAECSKKVTCANQQIQATRVRVNGLLINEANKAALNMDPEFNRSIARMKALRSEDATLQWEILQLRNCVNEILGWSTAMSPVLPPDELTQKLKPRLVSLLNRWEQQAPNPATGSNLLREIRTTTASEGTLNATRLEHGSVEALAETIVQVSQAVSVVVRMAEDGVGENEILKYIQGYGSRFKLEATEIIFLHKKGIAQSLILAMLQHNAKQR